MTEHSNETTEVLGATADVDTGGLVAPATTPLPGSVEHDEFVLVDPGLLPAPELESRVVGIDHPIEPEGWRLADIAGLAGRFVAVFWAMSIAWLVIFSLLPLVVGWSPTVVSTGSMAPALTPGAVIHVDSGVDPQILGPGSIITYDDPNIPGRKVTHRVVEVLSESEGGPATGFRTKGDANGEVDAATVPIESVDGATRLVLPYAGLPQVWMNNGQWWLVMLLGVVTMLAGMIALDTFAGFWSGRSVFRRRSVASAVAIAIAVMLGGPASHAAFAASTDTSGSTFAAATGWWQEVVDADSPIAHWQLDETAPSGGGSPITLTEDFDGSPVTNQYNSGQIAVSTARARSGTSSLHKTTNNDPNGGWGALPGTVGNSFTFEVWVYRPAGYGGGAVDRLGLEDAGFNGYTFYVDHGSNVLRIDRRTNGGATGIGSSVSFNPPEDAWYRLRLVRSGSALSVEAFDASGTLLASTTATDATYASFDRWVVRGGHDYFIDDLSVTGNPGPPSIAADRIGTQNGTISGPVGLGVPSLVTGLSGTPGAFDFDGSAASVLIGDDPLINTSDRAERTVELRFEPDNTLGRQVLYEEGGSTNGLAIYLDGDRLFGHAWTSGWSNRLEVSTTAGSIAANTTYHVAVVLDAVTDRHLELYLDGSLIGTATKTDPTVWKRHTDDAAIGRVNGSTKFHDGNSSTANHFDGTVDEVVLYNTDLDADRIAIHYHVGA